MDLLIKLIESLKTNPTQTILGILVFLAAFAAYNSIENGELLRILAPNPAAEAALFERSIKASSNISTALDNLRVSTGAEKVIIRQFHNGRYDLTGIPFTSVSVTYISSTEKYSLIGFDSKPLAFMGETARMMWKRIDQPECVVFHDTTMPDIGLRSELAGTKRSVICPLVSLLNYPIGTLSVHYSDSKLTDAAIVARTEDVSVRIAGYLNEKRN